MIYVDKLRKYKRQSYCHMVTDGTLTDLHRAAKAASIDRHWFHNSKRFPHYDLREAERERAIANGAKEVSSKELVDIMKGLK